MEDLPKASTSPKWFQMYPDTDKGLSKEILQRARDTGYKAIILTVDAIGQSSSDDYAKSGNATLVSLWQFSRGAGDIVQDRFVLEGF